MEKEISSGIIIFRRTAEGPKFLLLYMGGGYWNFPKGKIEKEEKALEAAFRETEEETGLVRQSIRLIRGFRVYDNYIYSRNRKKISKTVIFYLAETRRREIRLPIKTGPGEKHEGYAWTTYSEATKMLTHENLRKNIKDAQVFIQGGARHKRVPAERRAASSRGRIQRRRPAEKNSRPAGGSQKFGTDGKL